MWLFLVYKKESIMEYKSTVQKLDDENQNNKQIQIGNPKSDPLVSVVLPVYNGQQYLKDAIDGVLSQSFTDFELIIINDGSVDATGEIARTYSDPRIRYFEQINQGTAATRNYGIQLARGKYIAYLDHDDLCLAGRLEKQVDFLNSHPDVALVGAAAEIWVGGKRSDRYHRHPVDSNIINFEALFDNRFVNSSVMFHRSVVNKLGGYSSEKSRQPPEDYELWSRMIRKHKMVNLPDVLTGYREVPGSMSRKGVNPFLSTVVKLSAENIAWASGVSSKEPDATGLAALYHRAYKHFPVNATRRGMLSLLEKAARRSMANKPESTDAMAKLLARYRLKLQIRYLDYRLGGLIALSLRSPLAAAAKKLLRKAQ